MLGTNVELAIVGNKCDLERSRVVPLAEVCRGLLFSCTSFMRSDNDRSQKSPHA